MKEMKWDRALSPFAGFGTVLLVAGGFAFAVFRFFSGVYAVEAQSILPVAPPSVNVTANPTVIPLGATSTITWTSTGAEYCSSGGNFGSSSLPLSGSIVIRPSAIGTYVFIVTCSNPAGTATASFTVPTSSAPAPILPPTPAPPSSIVCEGTNCPITPVKKPVVPLTSTCASQAASVRTAIDSAQSAASAAAAAAALGCTTITGTTDSGVQYLLAKDPSTGATIGVFIGPQD